MILGDGKLGGAMRIGYLWGIWGLNGCVLNVIFEGSFLPTSTIVIENYYFGHPVILNDRARINTTIAKQKLTWGHG